MVVIQGSSRSNGDTSKFVKHILASRDWQHVDLLQYTIGHFDYAFNNKSDDFLPLIKDLILKHDHFVFASPVYWYSMSGVMKVFLDRFSDLLIHEKELGRKLRGKSMSVLSVSGNDDVSDSFYVPFRKSAAYLGIDYKGECHAYGDGMKPGHQVTERLKEFLAKH